MSGGSIGGTLGSTLGGIGGTLVGGPGFGTMIGAGLGGAAGGGIGSAASGGGNPLSSALLGGLTGLLGGAVGGALDGGFDAAGDVGTADTGSALTQNAAGDTGTGATGTTGTQALGANAPSSLPVAPTSDFGAGVSPDAAGNSVGSVSPPNQLQNYYNSLTGGGGSAAPSNLDVSGANAPQTIAGPNGSTIINMGKGANSSGSGGLSDYLLGGGVGLGALNAMGVFGTQGSNPVNTAPMQAASAGINTPLPQYNYTSTSTPYTGNWYTYGQRPETPQITNRVMPAAQGGLVRGYAGGGMIRPLQMPMSKMPERHMAMGGMPMQAPMGAPPPQPMAGPPMPPQGAGMPPQGMMPQQKPNPMANAAAFQQGHKIGQMLRAHIKNQGMTPDGIVNGPGKGQDDVVPAKLSQQEYIIPADVVGQLGDGSSNAGGKELDKMVTHVRAHKTSHKGGFPPKAKSPLAYIGK